MTSVHPEVAALLHRARARRAMLEGLLAVVPDEAWHRRAPDDAWSAHIHLAHLASADDGALAVLLAAQIDGAFASERDAAIIAAARRSADALQSALVAGRERFEAALRRFGQQELDGDIRVVQPGAWPAERFISKRAYLETWAAHDVEHAEAIRRAIATPPGPSELALAARLRRR